jgi:RNA-directed DNA polymerase
MHLFSTPDEVQLIEELFEAYFECRRNKRNTRSALAYERSFEQKVFRLAERVLSGAWSPSPARAFLVREPVLREVFAAEFDDRVVHHWLMGKLVPHFESLFIEDSYACRVGKGTHFGIRRLAQRMHSTAPHAYVLKLDIQAFFMSIPRSLLWERLQVFILEHYTQPDRERVLYITKSLVLHDATWHVKRLGKPEEWKELPRSKSMFGTKPGLGLPIGNLSSQVFANFYLHALDAFVTQELGIHCYGRYVDDFYLIHSSKSKLLDCRRRIDAFVKSSLSLQLHPKKIHLQHVSKGVSFLGAYIRPTHVVPGKRLKGNMHDMVQWVNAMDASSDASAIEEKARARLNAYFGLTHEFKAYRLRRRTWLALSPSWKKRLRPDAGYLKVTLASTSITSPLPPGTSARRRPRPPR